MQQFGHGGQFKRRRVIDGCDTDGGGAGNCKDPVTQIMKKKEAFEMVAWSVGEIQLNNNVGQCSFHLTCDGGGT